MSVSGRARTSQWAVVAVALVAAMALTVAVGIRTARNGVALLAVGLALCVALYQAAFGFTSAFRVFLSDGQGAGLRALLVMLAIACALFFPALGAGDVFGHRLVGNLTPLNVSLAVGAFLFGIGMQPGGGSVPLMLTLVFFIVGSVVGIGHLPFWAALPGLSAVSLVASLGWPLAITGNFSAFGVLWLGVAWVERRRHGRLVPIASGGDALRGPWPLVVGAVALAAANFATLLLAGRPWGITSAYGLWGGMLLALAEIDVSGWGGWATLSERAALVGPVLGDVTSDMDFDIMLGALLAAGLAGHFVVHRAITARRALGAVVGGLLFGYGARMAYGCDIGAFFSGIASGSLHGWRRIICALPGTYLGTRLRPWFGMTVKHHSASAICDGSNSA